MGTVNRLTAMNGSSFGTQLRSAVGLLILMLLTAGAAAAQGLVLQLDPVQSTVQFSLGASLHTVHGTFQTKRGALRANLDSAKASGEIVADATSGESGSGMRDRKMHKEVLESERYPEIIFRPDRVDGAVAVQGKSSVKVHGVFSVHNSDHEITIPAEVDIGTDHWTAHAHFTIPYVKWGIKNPSTLFLHVSDEVEIDVVVAGTLTRETAAIRPAQ
jgi:polyisoprenoid-binding protein YceI